MARIETDLQNRIQSELGGIEQFKKIHSTIFIHSGGCQICPCDPKTSKTCNIQSPSLPNPMCLQHRRTELEHWVQRIVADHCWDYRQFRTGSHLQNANLQLKRKRHHPS